MNIFNCFGMIGKGRSDVGIIMKGVLGEDADEIKGLCWVKIRDWGVCGYARPGA